MTAALIGWLVARPWALRLARWAIIALVVLLFLLAVRRAGERAGRLAERLEQLERNDVVRKRMLEAATRRPRDRGELARRMRDGWF
ncbi:MAG: hypothetical protein ACQEUZ_01305 [Pseudomonadota bacterium]